MRMDREGIRCVWGAVVLSSSFSIADAAVVSLTAVKQNGADIEPSNQITAFPGDTIEAEIRISGWAGDLPDGVRSFDVTVLGKSGAVSGANGLVLPLGWDAPVNPAQCQSPDDCDPEQNCNGFCLGPSHAPSLGAFIHGGRPDFILAGFAVIDGVGTSSLDYNYFGVADESGVMDTGNAAYAGTLILAVSEDACGTFRFELAPCGRTLLGSPTNESIEPALAALVLQLPGCPVLPVESDPPNCSIDARIPHAQGIPEQQLGWQTLDLRFSANPAGVNAASFRTRTVPSASVSPVVESVMALGENRLRLELDQPIPLIAWTCIEHRASAREACLAHLPGDADQDGSSGPEDLLALAMNLRRPSGTPPMSNSQCDIDRSSRCGPLDLLSDVDLLNGNGYFEFMEATLKARSCPSQESLDDRRPLGACCTQVQACLDELPEGTCVDAGWTWVRDGRCCGGACLGELGACCSLASGTCTDGIAASSCQDFTQAWTESTACSQASCVAELGACCNTDAGSCTSGRLQQQCDGGSEIWYPGYGCQQILCQPH